VRCAVAGGAPMSVRRNRVRISALVEEQGDAPVRDAGAFRLRSAKPRHTDERSSVALRRYGVAYSSCPRLHAHMSSVSPSLFRSSSFAPFSNKQDTICAQSHVLLEYDRAQ
jgi:hypothetical protein